MSLYLFLRVLKKINDYCSASIDESKLGIVEKKGIESLTGFLASPRLVQVINNYDSNEVYKISMDTL